MSFTSVILGNKFSELMCFSIAYMGDILYALIGDNLTALIDGVTDPPVLIRFDDFLVS